MPVHPRKTRSKNGDPEPMAGLQTDDWRRPESMRSPGTGKAQEEVAALVRKRRLGAALGCWEANEKQICGPWKGGGRDISRRLEMKGCNAAEAERSVI